MASKRTIKRIVLTAFWLAVTGGVITLLVAANGREQKRRCSAVHISVQGTGERYFIAKEDIAAMLRQAGQPRLEGAEVAAIDLARLEAELEGNAWIADAELYFDRDDALHVSVTERQPIARVFARNMTSFYIDSGGTRLPLLPHISARVPVVTGYPSAKKPAGPKDSAIVRDVRRLVQYISSHELWSAQIAQIDIMPDWSLELLPTVGNHTIRLGSAEGVEEKLERLLLFYQKVLSKTGFDRYSALDLRYAGQIVAVRGGTATTVDSARLQQNIRALLQADQMLQAHAAAAEAQPQMPAAPAPEAAKEQQEAVEQKSQKPAPAGANNKPAARNEPKQPAAPGKSKATSTEQKEHTDQQRQPKAVMPRRAPAG